MYVKKSSGELAEFSQERLKKSLINAGASEAIADRIVSNILNIIQEEISTGKIYSEAFRMLKTLKSPAANRYNLKKAILQLGPSGYPFEKFVGEIFKSLNYEVKVGTVVEGRCVSHEVDVWAKKPGEWLMLECKFRNRQGEKVDVKNPLYIKSRFDDVVSNWRKENGENPVHYQGGIVTNSHFSVDALRYGNCVKLKMISWEHPNGKSLKNLIDQSDLHPVTCLTSLNKRETTQLLETGIVLCKSLLQNPRALDELTINNRKKNKVLKEVRQLYEEVGG